MNLQSIQTRSNLASLSDQAPPGQTTSGSVKAGCSSLLPDPGPLLGAADLGAEIAALAVQNGQVEQKINTDAAEAQDSIEDQAEAAQVATLHQEASTERAGAWESGLMQIGAGACSIASASVSVGATAGSSAAAHGEELKGLSEALSGGATLTSGLSKAAATDSDAGSAAAKALADAAQRSGQTARDGEKSATDFIQSALSFYREYETAKNQAQAAAVHNA